MPISAGSTRQSALRRVALAWLASAACGIGAAWAAAPADLPKPSPQAPPQAAPAPASAAGNGEAPLTGTGQRIYERTRPLLLQVRTLLKTQDSQSSVGSGFLVDTPRLRCQPSLDRSNQRQPYQGNRRGKNFGLLL